MKYADFMKFQDVQLFLKKFSFYDAKTKIWLVGTLEHGLPRLWRDSWTSPMIFRTIFNPTKIHWVSHFFLQNRWKSLKIMKYCGAHQNCYFVAHLCVFLSFSSNREICGHNVYKCHQPIDCASHELTHYYFTLLKKVSGTKFLPKLGCQQQIRQFWWPSQFIPTYFWVQST